MQIALVVNFTNPQAINTAVEVIKVITSCGARVLMLSSTQKYIESPDVTYISDENQLFENCDVVVTVGGDGTIIRSAKFAALMSKPIIGVNLGRIGFVAELEPTEINMLKKVVKGDYTLMKRMVLGIEVMGKEKETSFIAINDAVISRGALSRIIEFDVSVEGEKIATYRADGLLFSTPTGSTAYALSAGGPVIDPKLSLIELTPVCPHSLTARSVLFTDDTVLSVQCKSSDAAYLTVDGQESLPINEGEKLVIKASAHTLNMINLKEKNFYRIVGEKLRDGK